MRAYWRLKSKIMVPIFYFQLVSVRRKEALEVVLYGKGEILLRMVEEASREGWDVRFGQRTKRYHKNAQRGLRDLAITLLYFHKGITYKPGRFQGENFYSELLLGMFRVVALCGDECRIFNEGIHLLNVVREHYFGCTFYEKASLGSDSLYALVDNDTIFVALEVTVLHIVRMLPKDAII
jgi:hypothetical protein